MTRRALIIGAPDANIPGVTKDMANYREFLLSPLGGAWKSDEIVTLTSPAKASVLAQVKTLATVDYSLTIFAGHGRHLMPQGTTVVVLQPNVEMDSMELRQGAAKHTLILDCCRMPSTERIAEARMLAKAAREIVLNAAECRKFFDHRIAECAKGLVVQFACSVGETAGESQEGGGYYSSSLILAAEEWKAGAETDVSKNFAILSVLSAHNNAAVRVKKLSGNRQNPTAEYPRSEKHFPFAVLA